MEILKNLGIETLPPENIKVSIKKRVEAGQTYFFAHVYLDMGDAIGIEDEFLGALIAFNEQSLAEQLKNVYGYQIHLKERTFENFYNWYREIANIIPSDKMLEINKKFNK